MITIAVAREIVTYMKTLEGGATLSLERSFKESIDMRSIVHCSAKRGSKQSIDAGWFY